MKNFKELRVWQKGFEISIQCYRLTRYLPQEERYGLVSQINRSSISIPTNIAEGSSRSSEKEYRHFLEIALGSSYELETFLLLVQSLALTNAKDTQPILCGVKEVQKMLVSFIQKLTT